MCIRDRIIPKRRLGIDRIVNHDSVSVSRPAKVDVVDTVLIREGSVVANHNVKARSIGRSSLRLKDADPAVLVGIEERVSVDNVPFAKDLVALIKSNSSASAIVNSAIANDKAVASNKGDSLGSRCVRTTIGNLESVNSQSRQIKAVDRSNNEGSFFPLGPKRHIGADEIEVPPIHSIEHNDRRTRLGAVQSGSESIARECRDCLPGRDDEHCRR